MRTAKARPICASTQTDPALFFAGCSCISIGVSAQKRSDAQAGLGVRCLHCTHVQGISI